ncbi:hypothetical protein [Actinomadura sp. 7K534]|uniref:hypothetical protein n=1 Tax=Actinomadura sp. 7K534 TaxID=2530366 RepID=UPI001046F566|nr:hypothetical protein [Actinomadura sp. 7K534]TDB96542.1 hypothetical protein E1266_09605 [Actinomadura sp. 7K534]
MRDEGAAERGRAPARVVLRGEPGGWHYVIVDAAGAERRRSFPVAGTRWRTGAVSGPEPAWWRRRLAETAETLREVVAERLTDATFRDLGVEADITWFAVDEPVVWEGLVTLREADPARFPGQVAPFVIALQPGRGALLPDASLLFSTRAADAWSTLAALAERCGTPPPEASLLCGWAGHRSVRVGRGRLALSTVRDEDGVERLAEICALRPPGWSGNPELRPRFESVDLLDEPAGDVVALLRELGHEIVRRGRTARLPASGLTLYEPDDAEAATERFTGVSLRPPAAAAPLWGPVRTPDAAEAP